jgi:hypothetical protein
LLTGAQEIGGVKLAVCWALNPWLAAGQESTIEVREPVMVIAGGGMTVKVTIELVTLPDVPLTTTE